MNIDILSYVEVDMGASLIELKYVWDLYKQMSNQQRVIYGMFHIPQ